ncbi:winged helix-turn-helix domain-containing protein [Rhizobium sp. BK176]|uniref:winged helix-turn-helix domain-containing protein n=1 Tax=Rhizobium sp. BK176 TaxID=2587071 RepID=UPI00216890A5|nr:winged helix-turn-helix domain-containing protein [Rhizobium sp. BK176]
MQPLYEFGPFVLDPVGGTLTRQGKRIPLGLRGVALLKVLLEAKGETVGKSVLMECAWPGAIVEESNLTVQIAALRKALGLRPDNGDWITTVPRIGYRLLKLGHSNGETLASMPVLAVLPFAFLGDSVEQEYFADGIVYDIITALSRFRSFAVVARNSSFAYKGRDIDVREVAKELGVPYVLTGSVRRAGNQLRITTQLIDGANGSHLWAETFDGAVDDVFSFQDRITEKVATGIAPEIQLAEIQRSRRDRPGSVDAYDTSLLALSKILAETSAENAAAHRLLSNAIDAEPHNAYLLALAAWTLEHRINMGWPPLGPNDREKCFEWARRGLDNAAGDPTAMAHCAMALVQVAKEYDWGMAVLAAALEANPNNVTVMTASGVAHLHCGDLHHALELFGRATKLSPRDLLAHIPLCGTAHAHIALGQYELALSYAARALASNPNFDPTYWMMAAANAHLGRLAEARRYLAKLMTLSPSVTIEAIRSGHPDKDPKRLANVLNGLRLAGMSEG